MSDELVSGGESYMNFLEQMDFIYTTREELRQRQQYNRWAIEHFKMSRGSVRNFLNSKISHNFKIIKELDEALRLR